MTLFIYFNKLIKHFEKKVRALSVFRSYTNTKQHSSHPKHINYKVRNA